jgi:hypothetical protein
MTAPRNRKLRYTGIMTMVILSSLYISCSYKSKQGDELSTSQLNYIKSLGLLDEEKIILFDTQADLKTSGNFFTDKRLASYWIDKRDSSKNSIQSAFYAEIDSIKTKDLTKSLTYASFLKITKHDGTNFHVYIDGDSAEVWTFFNRAITTWKKTKDK